RQWRAVCWRGAWWSGVRFVQLYSGGGPLITQWDAHKDLVANHEKMCDDTDQPIAALLKDLKQRGLLDSTLVIWGSEFGRTPMSQGGDGRDRNPQRVPCGSPAAARRAEGRLERRMSWGCAGSASGILCATSMRPYCNCWVWIRISCGSCIMG